MALRKVRNNLDRFFDKNLTDLIRGIRNNKENEAKYISACIEEIKSELRQEHTFVKANAVEKLAYLQMLGYDISWASFNIIEVMASTKFSEKRIGYLAATQCFNNESDNQLIVMTTNMIRKDLQSTNLYDVGVALSGLSCFATHDLARDLVNDVVNLLSSSRPYVRKKAVLVLYKIFLRYPDALKPTFPRLREKLEDPDPGVQCAAVNVICELARKNPKNYLKFAPTFFNLMNTSSNNWMLIKIIKLFGSLVPLEARLGKKLLEPLTNLINNTSAMSLLYECINTVIAVLISISSETPDQFTHSIQLCVQKLGVLIEDSDQNLKYLGLLAMGRILKTHPKAVQAHKNIVMKCLDDKDESIRLRALDLLYGMVSKKNIMEIVKKLMEHVDAAEGSFYRDELLARIIDICSFNNYFYITNFEWYISVLVEMTKVEGSKHGVRIAEQIQDVTVRVQSIRHFSVSQMALLVENAHLLLSGNSAQRNNVSEVLLAAAWICGEYSEHVRDVSSVLEAMLRTKMSIVPGPLLSIYMQNIAKLYAVQLTQFEKDDDWDAIESLDNLMLSKLPEFQLTDHLEAQERACNFVEVLKFTEKEHGKRHKMSEAFDNLFKGELNPVATRAQRKVPLPEGLDLDQPIFPPEPDSEEESEASEPEQPDFPTMSAQSPIYETAGEASPRPGKKVVRHEEMKLDLEESRRRRQQEQENNPYYVKQDKRAAPSKKLVKGIDRSESLQTAASELQSPLEIPGVIGLDRYLKQQSSTLSWKTAKSELESKKKKKGGKKGRRKRATLSSSDDGGDAVVVHQVNRDAGEMPEGALSSNGEEDRNGVDDEFKALDVNLDEPLREEERLFVPKPYRRPEETSNVLRSNSVTSPQHDAPARTPRVKENGEKASKKEKKPKKKAKAVRKRKKSEKSVEENYTSIESTAKPSKAAAAVANELIVAEALAAGNGYGLKSGGKKSKLNALGHNDDLAVDGRMAAVNVSVDGVRGVAHLRVRNKNADTVRRLELSVFETEQAKLDTPGVADSASIMLPFELTAGASNEHTLHFAFHDVETTQRIRVTLMYCVEKADGRKSEDRISFTLVFPVLSFVVYATLGQSSFELVMRSDAVTELACEQAASSASLKSVMDEITTRSNFSVVECTEEAAFLYAMDVKDAPICVLVKRRSEGYQVEVRSASTPFSQALAQGLRDLVAAHTTS